MPIGPAKSFTQRHPYNDWARAQNVPIVEDFGIDIHAQAARAVFLGSRDDDPSVPAAQVVHDILRPH